MVLVLLLSFLPWIEIGCESKADLGNQLGGMGGGQVKITPPGLGTGPQIFATQSGFQIAAGKYSKTGLIADLPEGGGQGPNLGAPGAKGPAGGGKDGPDAAPLLWLFFLGILAAIGAGFALPPSRLRVIVVGTSVGVAVLVLLVQWLILGFPAAKDVGKESQDAVTIFVRYRPEYWLTWVLLVGGLVLLAVEERLAPKGGLTEPVLEVEEGEPPPPG
jgi:hypothetical protein